MLHYLTIQDVLWINHEIAKTVNEYKFAQLEEATFGQYGYGKSEDVLAQAGAFLEGFIRLRPFSSHNRATAFISALTFLQINGRDIQLDPETAADWALEVAKRQVRGEDAVKSAVGPGSSPVAVKPAIRTDVHDLMERYEQAVQALTD
jgi:prophage maintenance system killer protein